jgi:DNA-directed RNA polymerase subunit beta'
MITPEAAAKIEDLGIDSVMVRSPLTSESRSGAACSTTAWTSPPAAWSKRASRSASSPPSRSASRARSSPCGRSTPAASARGRSPRPSTAPSTAARSSSATATRSRSRTTTATLLVSLKRNGELVILDDKGRELEKTKVDYGAFIYVKPGDKVKRGESLVKWDPHRTPILAEKGGTVQFVDIEIGETVREEDAGPGQKALVVIEHKGDLHPQINIVDDDGNILDFHYLPAKARLEVADGEQIEAGHMLARQPAGRRARRTSSAVCPA